MAVLGIGMTARDQPFDHRHHRPDVFRRARLKIGAERPQRIHIRVIPADGFLGPLMDQRLHRARIPRRLARRCGGVDLVIDVGEIAGIGHMIRAINMAQQPIQRVEHHHRPPVAQMRPVIDRGAADIHPHVFRVQGHERLFGPGFRIVQPDRDHVLSRRSPCGAGLS